MAKRQFELTEKEVAVLRQAEQQTRDVHELRCLQVVRLYSQGMPTRDRWGGGLRNVQPAPMGDALPSAGRGGAA